MPTATPLQPVRSQWSFSSITNTCENRSLSGRKRTRDEEDERALKKATHAESLPKRHNKRPRLTEEVVSVSNTVVDERKFVSLLEETEYGVALDKEDQTQSSASENALDVSKVLAFLLEAINESSKEDEQHTAATSDAHTTHRHPYRRAPTSPLCGLPNRAPFVRKRVGGSCSGKVDTGLQRWVIQKNFAHDVQFYHPSYRSPEWIETLHEMGWEYLHPSYNAQYEAYMADDNCDEWIEIDVETDSSRSYKGRQSDARRATEEGVFLKSIMC